MRVAVNVSAHQLAGGRLPERVREVLERTGIDPGQLEIELTESAMMTDSEHGARQVETISRMGVSIALDDFGTGYSSLAYLSRFCAHQAEDRPQLRRWTGPRPEELDHRGRHLGLARGLGLRVVAEGVETEEQRCLPPRAATRCRAICSVRLWRPPRSAR